MVLPIPTYDISQVPGATVATNQSVLSHVMLPAPLPPLMTFCVQTAKSSVIFISGPITSGSCMPLANVTFIVLVAVTPVVLLASILKLFGVPIAVLGVPDIAQVVGLNNTP